MQFLQFKIDKIINVVATHVVSICNMYFVNVEISTYVKQSVKVSCTSTTLYRIGIDYLILWERRIQCIYLPEVHMILTKLFLFCLIALLFWQWGKINCLRIECSVSRVSVQALSDDLTILIVHTASKIPISNLLPVLWQSRFHKKISNLTLYHANIVDLGLKKLLFSWNLYEIASE